MTANPPQRVAIQGEPGSFHHAAARQLCGEAIQLVCCDRFSQVFESIASGQADVGMVACENSLYGSIAEVYDLLLRYQIPIAGQHIEHIHQNLIAHPETDLASIREVYSHPVALDQCREWLAAHLPEAELIEHHDTAGAVEEISRTPSPYTAAIAGVEAARLYDLPILVPDIEDEAANLTRFLLLDPQYQPSTSTTRASLVLTIPHQPGALYRALGVFSELGINLTKLESRPIRHKAFQYQFIVDIEATPTQVALATDRLESIKCDTRILGLY